jgi:hypothetical protein
MTPVFVNGQKHRSSHDAAITTGGTDAGIRKAISCGLKYRGFHVSHELPEENVPLPMKHYPGLSLIPHPQVTP